MRALDRDATFAEPLIHYRPHIDYPRKSRRANIALRGRRVDLEPASVKEVQSLVSA